MTKNYITYKGAQRLKDEMRQLLNVERPKVVSTVSWAASNGDRSENGDYIYGKKRLRQIDSRIRFLKKRIEDAEVIRTEDIPRNGKVVFGSWVDVCDSEGLEKSFQIVGEDESEPNAGKISWKAPLAKALFG